MHKRFNTTSINKLLFELSYPAIIGLSITALYNIVDSMFVGKGIGVVAVSAVSLVFPINNVIMAISLMIGQGAASLVSISLGAKNYKRISHILNITFIYGIFFSILAGFTIILFKNPIIELLGGDLYTNNQALDYLLIMAYALPFSIFSMINNNLIRAEGRSKVIMTSMLIGAFSNIIMDAIFILYFKWGVKGAAYATLFAQVFSVSFQIWHYFSDKSVFLKYFNLKEYEKKTSFSILKIGSSSFVRNVAGSIIIIFMNKLALIYGNYITVAAIGISNRLSTLIFLPAIGLAQGFQPMAGYFYGAKNYKKILASLKVSLISITIIISFTSILILVFPNFFVGMFTDDILLLKEGIHVLRFFIIMMPIIGIQIIGSVFFQSTNKANKAMILTMSRQLLILIPLLIILPRIYGKNGIWISIPVSDFLSVLISSLFLFFEVKKIRLKLGVNREFVMK